MQASSFAFTFGFLGKEEFRNLTKEINFSNTNGQAGNFLILFLPASELAVLHSHTPILIIFTRSPNRPSASRSPYPEYSIVHETTSLESVLNFKIF